MSCASRREHLLEKMEEIWCVCVSVCIWCVFVCACVCGVCVCVVCACVCGVCVCVCVCVLDTTNYMLCFSVLFDWHCHRCFFPSSGIMRNHIRRLPGELKPATCHSSYAVRALG